MKTDLSIESEKSTRGYGNQPGGRSSLQTIAKALIAIGLFSAGVLLVATLRGISDHTHAYLSSVPLALAGFGYALLQTALRPEREALLKRMLLAVTFVGWAVDQLLPAGRIAVFLGDLVIAVYVLDLYWIAQEQTAVEPGEAVLSKDAA